MIGIGPWRAFELASAIGEQVEDNLQAMRKKFRQTVARGQQLAGLKRDLTDEERQEMDAVRERLQSIVDGWDGDWVPSRDEIATRVNGLNLPE